MFAYEGLAPQWSDDSFAEGLEIWPGPELRKMLQIGQGGPPGTTHQFNKHTAPKRALGALWGPGFLYNSRSQRLSGPLCSTNNMNKVH